MAKAHSQEQLNQFLTVIQFRSGFKYSMVNSLFVVKKSIAVIWYW